MVNLADLPRKNLPSGLTAVSGHFFSRGIGAMNEYFARSVRHFFASTGLSKDRYNSISRSRASGMRVLPC
jgi:hypothetical protein